MQPLRLTDNQLTELLRLAAPLEPHCRDALLRIVAHEFRGRADIGDGELFRTARRIIKDYKLFSAPALHEPASRAYA
jgi:hypothetical protein